MNEGNNLALMALGAVFVLDGDLMRCRSCGRSLIASRDGEELRHAASCKHIRRTHPWKLLRAAISDDCSKISTLTIKEADNG